MMVPHNGGGGIHMYYMTNIILKITITHDYVTLMTIKKSVKYRKNTEDAYYFLGNYNMCQKNMII